MDNGRFNNSKSRLSFYEPHIENQWPANRRDRAKRIYRYEEYDDDITSYKKREHSLDRDHRVFREDHRMPHPEQQAFMAYNSDSTDNLFADNSRPSLSTMPYNMMTGNHRNRPIDPESRFNMMTGCQENRTADMETRYNMMTGYQGNSTSDSIETTFNMLTGNQGNTDTETNIMNFMQNWPNMMTSANTPCPSNSFENIDMSQHNIAAEIIQSSTSNMNPYAFMGVQGENQHLVKGPVKEIVRLESCVLYPPNPYKSLPIPPQRPLGCKTIFVGGLPEKITEQILEEIFVRYGSIETIKMTSKKTCHIRFTEEIDANVLNFFEYILKIGNKSEPLFTGKLHIDYAQTRDDQYDYECKERALKRQARHQEENYIRPTTPPVRHYTDNEASVICEQLKKEETFTEAVHTLIKWLHNGNCNKKTAGSFFSMIQSAHTCTMKLQLAKVNCEEEINKAKAKLQKHVDDITEQFIEIEKIYEAASLQKCWDHFTKAQRKSISTWKKHTEELKNMDLKEETIESKQKIENKQKMDDDMELSDDDNDTASKNDIYIEQLKKQHKEETDSLRCQLKDAQEVILVLKSDHMTAMRKDLQSILQVELQKMCAFKCRMTNGENDSTHENKAHLGPSTSTVSETEIRLISLLSTALQEPSGANIDSICSYLQQVDSTAKSRDFENLLKKYSESFGKDSKSNEDNLKKDRNSRWN